MASLPGPAGWGTATLGSWIPHPMIKIVPTYSSVMQTAVAHARGAEAGSLPGGFKNQLTRLRKALSFLGESDDRPASALCESARFEACIERVNQSFPGSKKARQDITSSLRWWRRQVADLFPGVSIEQDVKPHRLVKQKTLAASLRAAIKRAKMSQKQVADDADVPIGSLERWLRGGLPDQRSIEGLKRVAAVLRIDESLLLACVSHRSLSPPTPVSTRYGELLKELRGEKYLLPEDALTEQLLLQWDAFLRWNTDEFDRKKPRPLEQGWKIHETVTTKHQREWFAIVDGRYVPTASAYWKRVHAFVSFLANVGGSAKSQVRPVQRPIVPARAPLGKELAQTLAWFALKRCVAQYGEWHKERAGGYNNSARNFFSLARMLCAKETGWLRLNPELASTLPDSDRPLDWGQACDEVVEYCRRLTKRDRSGRVAMLTRSRDPFEMLDWYLKFEDPVDPIVRAIQSLDTEANALQVGSLRRATRLRDAALLSLMLMLPLREGTAAHLKWGDHVWLQNGALKVCIPPKHLKNGDKKGSLQTELSGPLVQYVMRYVNEGRPVLMGDMHAPHLFLSSRREDLGQPWGGLSAQCKAVTSRLCSGYGLPEHSFRHLIATRHLRMQPGDYLGVANLLWDSLDTVISTYAPADPTGAVARNAQSVNLNPTMKERAV